MKGMTYEDTGVYRDLKEEASKIMYEASQKTWENRKGKIGEVVAPFKDFSGFRGIRIGNLPRNSIISLSLEGCGTKLEVAQRECKHDTAAYELLAMLCDDDARNGAEPVIVGSVLDVNRLGEGKGKDRKDYLDFVKQLADGMIGTAKEAGVAVINGEIEELGYMIKGYGDFNYVWGGASVPFVREDRILTGSKIKSGDSLVALREDGFRSNGISLARKVLKEEYGNAWHEKRFKGQNMGKLVLHPSRIYSKAMVDMTGGFEDEPKVEIHGAAHVTGGGIPTKLGRILKPNKLGACIDNAFKPPELMLHCQEIGSISDEEAYRTWPMGQGMILTTPEPDDAIKIAGNHSIRARVIGTVTKEPKIKIKSKGFYRPDEVLTL